MIMYHFIRNKPQEYLIYIFFNSILSHKFIRYGSQLNKFCSLDNVLRSRSLGLQHRRNDNTLEEANIFSLLQPKNQYNLIQRQHCMWYISYQSLKLGLLLVVAGFFPQALVFLHSLQEIFTAL